jgi:hypothetical protein
MKQLNLKSIVKNILNEDDSVSNKKSLDKYLLDNGFKVERNINTNNSWGFGGAVKDVYTKGKIIVNIGVATQRHTGQFPFITISKDNNRIFDETQSANNYNKAKETVDKLINKVKEIKEGYNPFISQIGDDFITKNHKKRDLEIRKLKLKRGMWVNLSDEFGDVWHEVDRIYESKDFYASVYIYDRISNDSDKSKITSEYYYEISKVSDTLPTDARVIMSKEGTQSPRRNNMKEDLVKNINSK